MDIDETRYYREADGNLLKLEIGRDEDPLNPRTDWDNVGTMVCFHRRYTLGDVRTLPDGRTDVIPHTNVRYDNSADGVEAFVEWAKRELKDGNLVIASLELYDHSGIAMSINSWGESAFEVGRTGWDSGIVGWIFVTKYRAYEELAIKNGEDWTERVKDHIRYEVKTYDDYLTGEVYRTVLSRLSSYKIVENGTEVVRFPGDACWEAVDSCGGFFGSDHDENGVLECLPNDAVRIKEDELPEQAKEAA